MSDMARKQILPAVVHYAADVARDAAGKKALDTEISDLEELSVTLQPAPEKQAA